MGPGMFGELGPEAAEESDDLKEETYDLRSRHVCTDSFCGLLFLGCLAAFGVLYRFAATRGDVGRLFQGIDYAGGVCGVDGGLEDRPLLYWCASATASDEHGESSLRLHTGKPVCVSSCPTGALEALNAQCAMASGNLAEMAPYRTVPLLGRYCIPDTSEDKGISQQVAYELNNMGTDMQQMLSFLWASRRVLVMAFASAVLLGCAYLVLLRYFAEPLIWLSIVATIALASVFGWFFWFRAETALQELPMESSLRRNLEHVAEGHRVAFARACALICFAFAGAMSLAGYCMGRSIRVTSACVKVACEAIFKMPSLLAAPVIKVLVRSIVSVGLMFGLLLLWTSSKMTTGDDGLTRQFQPDADRKVQLVFYAFMSLWVFGFIGAVYQFTVAYAVVEYYGLPYRTDGTKRVSQCGVLEGAQIALFSHPGSLACGSLLITLLSSLSSVLRYAERANEGSQHNQVACCCTCCAGWLVRFAREVVEKVNRSAYIEIAITSSDFCDAAQQALSTMTSMAASWGVLAGATYAFTLFGVAAISCGAGYISYAVASGDGPYAATVGSPVQTSTWLHVDGHLAVTGASTSLAAFVAFALMDVVDVASDTLLYCYQRDTQAGDGGHTAPSALQELFKQG